VGEIDSAACRRRAEHFGVDQMCARYEAVYEAVLDRPVVRAASVPTSVVS
jgi:hypothetical protein